VQVFICWSGPTSERIAQALRDWLDDIFHGIRIYLSTEDIRPGKRWAPDLTENLASTDLGIVCLTPDNLKSPWLHFEAGVVSRDLENGVTSLLCGISANDVSAPLAQFQNTPADRDNVFKLVKEINGRIAAGSGPRRPDNKLTAEFKKRWRKLEQEIQSALEDAAQSNQNSGAQDPVILALERFEKLVEMLHTRLQALEAEVQALRHSPHSARGSTVPTRRTPRRLRTARRNHVNQSQGELPF